MEFVGAGNFKEIKGKYKCNLVINTCVTQVFITGCVYHRLCIIHKLISSAIVNILN